MQEEVLILSEEEISGILSEERVIDISEQVFRAVGNEKVIFAHETFLPSGLKGKNRFMANPVSFPDDAVGGLKWISMYAEPEKGYPFSHGNLIVLNDLRTASPLAIMGASKITEMRTAGGHAAVAAKYLSNPNPQKLAVLGGGAQGTSGVRALLKLYPSLREICVYRPRDNFRAAVGDKMVCCKTPEEAARNADIILMASNAFASLVMADWVKPGATILGINAFRDLDPSLAKKADKWILGHKESDVRNIIHNPELNQQTVLSENLVYGDMCEIVCGRKPGRTAVDEIIVYTHMGMGAFDVACANAVYQKALQTGAGTRVRI